MNDLIELAGGVNIAHDATGSVLLSAERLIQANPDVILCINGFTTPADMAHRPGLAELRAAKSGRIHSIERRWLVAGHSLPEAVAHLRTIIRGERPRQEN
jgi:ABC-type hemin transport system substrate-binding protein